MAKKNTVRLVGIAGLVLVGMLAASARAGLKQSNPVTIDMVNKSASGSFGSARNSSDSNQYIGCTVDARPSGGYVYCSARNSAGTGVSCTSTNQNLINTALSLTGDSGISFYWDAAANCTELAIINYSLWEPRSP